MSDETKPCLLCTSKIKEIKSDEKNPIILIKLSKPTSHDAMLQAVRGVKDVFPENCRVLVMDTNVDVEVADEFNLARIGLRRMEK